MFLNISNHSSTTWSTEQKNEAMKYGDIKDYMFPPVDPYMSEEAVKQLLEKVYNDVVKLKPDCIMCSGEYTLTYSLVKRFKDEGIKVVAACSERIAREYIDDEGNTKKDSTFRFVRFREF